MSKTLNLSRYRIVAFATHGLVPGDLDGLTQPALALTAPDVAGVKGDGLLTMEKILALKLDADWVVLSACNTGGGSRRRRRGGVRSGQRLLLCRHARLAGDQLVGAFGVGAAIDHRPVSAAGDDPKLSRGEALRQAMMALIDGPGFVDERGKIALHLRASAVLGALFSHRRRRRTLRAAARREYRDAQNLPPRRGSRRKKRRPRRHVWGHQGSARQERSADPDLRAAIMLASA